MAASPKSVAVLVTSLILLGVLAQLWILYELRYDLPVFLSGDIGGGLAELAALFSPIVLSAGGAVLARWLHRRGSGWAMLAAGLPCAVLLLGIGLAVYFTYNPISFNHH